MARYEGRKATDMLEEFETMFDKEPFSDNFCQVLYQFDRHAVATDWDPDVWDWIVDSWQGRFPKRRFIYTRETGEMSGPYFKRQKVRGIESLIDDQPKNEPCLVVWLKEEPADMTGFPIKFYDMPVHYEIMPRILGSNGYEPKSWSERERAEKDQR